MQQLNARQLAEWEAYNTMEPIGEERSDFRISFLSSLITNLVIRALGKKGAKLTNVKDFVFKWDSKEEAKPQMKVEQFKAVFHQIASIANTNKDIKNKMRRTTPPRSKTNRK